MDTQKKSDLASAVCMAAVSLVLFILAIRLKGTTEFVTGGRLVPVTATVLMLTFAVLRCISVMRMADGHESRSQAIEIPKWAIAVVSLVVYAAIVETVGFIIATIALLVVLSPMFGVKKLYANLGAAVVITMCIWFLFTKIFGSYLPSGTLL